MDTTPACLTGQTRERVVCPLCGKVGSPDDFYSSRVKAKGYKNCRDCKRAENLARLAPRYEITDRIKLERGCEDARCAGHPPDAAVLDFDHRPGTDKVANVSRMMPAGTFEDWLARVTEEIAKCDVVCANCHRIRTARDRAANQRNHDMRLRSSTTR